MNLGRLRQASYELWKSSPVDVTYPALSHHFANLPSMALKLRPWLSRLKITDKNGQVIPLDLDSAFSWAQSQFVDAWEGQVNAGEPVRIITLKARQLGISTVTQAIAFTYCFAFDQTMNSLVVANEQDNSQHLLGMSNTFWDTWMFRDLYTDNMKYDSANKKTWKFDDGRQSSINVKTAKNVQSGRSRTIHLLHASEVAFWPKPSELMTGLRQAIPSSSPYTAIVLESTANGVGNYFQKMWKQATLGENEFKPLFFPWFHHPEYTAQAVGVEPRLDGTKTKDEIELERYHGVEESRLAWRRWAIRNLTEGSIDDFHQEYPSTPDEAFVTTGRNVFPLPQLKVVFEPFAPKQGKLIWDGSRPRFIEQDRGPLRIYRQPSHDTDWGIYLMGCDPTHASQKDPDQAAIQVINRRTLEQVAVWNQVLDPGTFADEIAKVGYYYNMAMAVPESEGPGFMSIGRLQGINYPNIWQHQRPDRTPGKVSGDRWGWSTTAQSKHLAIGWLLKLVNDGDLIIHDPATFSEMRDYVTLENGGYGNGDGSEYDDNVMALAIAVTAHMMEPPPFAYGESSQMPWEPPRQRPVWEEWGERHGLDVDDLMPIYEAIGEMD